MANRRIEALVGHIRASHVTAQQMAAVCHATVSNSIFVCRRLRLLVCSLTYLLTYCHQYHLCAC
jgi:hypothetical protein